MLCQLRWNNCTWIRRPQYQYIQDWSAAQCKSTTVKKILGNFFSMGIGVIPIPVYVYFHFFPFLLLLFPFPWDFHSHWEYRSDGHSSLYNVHTCSCLAFPSDSIWYLQSPLNCKAFWEQIELIALSLVTALR